MCVCMGRGGGGEKGREGLCVVEEKMCQGISTHRGKLVKEAKVQVNVAQ